MNNSVLCFVLRFSTFLLVFVNFYFISRLTLYRCIVCLFIQRSWLTRNLTIETLYSNIVFFFLLLGQVVPVGEICLCSPESSWIISISSWHSQASHTGLLVSFCGQCSHPNQELYWRLGVPFARQQRTWRVQRKWIVQVVHHICRVELWSWGRLEVRRTVWVGESDELLAGQTPNTGFEGKCPSGC